MLDATDGWRDSTGVISAAGMMDAVATGLYRGQDVIIRMGALVIGFCRENSHKGWDVHVREHAAIEVLAGNTIAHACLLAQQVGHRCTYPIEATLLESQTSAKPKFL